MLQSNSARGNAGQLPPSTSGAYFPALDGLRGIAVTLVFLQHYILTRLPPSASWGWTGVDIFFVLSGFLITGILFDSRDLAHRVRNFYVRRTLRIFPLYYGVFAIILLLTPWLHWDWTPLWWLWPVYLGNLARFLSFIVYGHMGLDALHSTSRDAHIYLGHFWSLCLEEQFYILWPLAIFSIRDRRRLLQLCLAVIVLSPLARAAAVFTMPQNFIDAELLYRLLPFRLDALLIGGALALLRRGPGWSRLARLTRPLLLINVVLFALAWFIAVSMLHQSPSAGPANPWISIVGFTLIDLFAAGIIVLCLDTHSAAFRVFTLAPLTALGRISYGFYVFHDIPHYGYELAIREISPHSHHAGLLTAALAFPCTVALAALSFRFFESPLLRLKDRFTLRSTVPSPHP